MAMATSDSSEASEILGADDCVSVFGTNERRAEIRYRRLAKAVHPDTSDAPPEAMARLNSLWDEYRSRKGMKPSDGTKRPVEITRDSKYAVFMEGGEVLVVEREASDERVPVSRDVFGVILDGTPVYALKFVDGKHISQGDGNHRAMSCKAPRFADEMVMLPSLKSALPHGELHPADLAWVTKRVIFLSGVLARLGKRLEGGCECLAICPESHMLVIVAPWQVADDDNEWHVAHHQLLQEYLGLVQGMAGDNAETKSIMKFVEGMLADSVTSPSMLMLEFDELLVSLFGGLRFHKMQTV